jgi:hypothetical protein
MGSASFKDPESLDELQCLIHDPWFDVDQIRLDGSTLTIPFAAGDTSRADRVVIDSRLRIDHVRDYELEDTQQVGLCNFNEIRFDAGTQRVVITTGVPLTFVADVAHLEIAVEIPA